MLHKLIFIYSYAKYCDIVFNNTLVATRKAPIQSNSQQEMALRAFLKKIALSTISYQQPILEILFTLCLEKISSKNMAIMTKSIVEGNILF